VPGISVPCGRIDGSCRWACRSLGRLLERHGCCNWRMRLREPGERRSRRDFSAACGMQPADGHLGGWGAACSAPTRECPVGILRSIEIIIGNLARAQSELLRAADAVPAEQWKTRPAEGRWSAGEVICHLSAIERAILRRADKLLQEPPKPAPFYKRFHVPMMFVEARVIRRKAPSALEPQMVREKEEMLAELRQVRERTLAFIEETWSAISANTAWRMRFWGHLTRMNGCNSSPRMRSGTGNKCRRLPAAYRKA